MADARKANEREQERYGQRLDRQRSARVDADRNTDADYEELPEVTDDDLARGEVRVAGVPVRGRPPLGDRRKKQVTLRLDQDVIEHFRSRGPGWQGRINAVLRRSMGAR